MKYNPAIHYRRSIRLREYDYTTAGAYFVTICTQNRDCLFGDIVDGDMVLNDAGRMVQSVWDGMSAHYAGIETDAFVIMPNHIHGIVTVGAAPRGRPDSGQDSGQAQRPAPTVTDCGQAQGPAPTVSVTAASLSLPDVVHRFKTLTTKRYTDGVKQHGWPPYPGRVWQRNYYEHIIRDGHDLNRTREYIVNNPAQWDLDRENPDGRAQRAMPTTCPMVETSS